MRKESQSLVRPLSDVTSIESNLKWGDVEDSSKALMREDDDSGVDWTIVGAKKPSRLKKENEVSSFKKNKENALLSKKTRSNKTGDILSTPFIKSIKKVILRATKLGIVVYL